jgi:hypothetical protein
MSLQCPPDAPAAECILYYRQINELSQQPYVSNIGDPLLIYASQSHLPGEVRVYRQCVPRIPSTYKVTLAQTKQIILAHQPQHELIVGENALPRQFVPNAAVALRRPFA